MAVSYLPVSWADYHLSTQKMAAAILSHSPAQDEIVAISRGGLTLGHLLSDLLQLPISTFTIQSYTDIQSQGAIHITHHLQSEIAGKKILLVDDVADSGKTLLRAVDYVKESNPQSVTTVTLFFKPQSIFRPDYYAKQTNKWILFPYEPTEMITLITKKLEKEGKKKSEIQEFLLKLGYREGQIAFTRKHHVKANR